MAVNANDDMNETDLISNQNTQEIPINHVNQDSDNVITNENSNSQLKANSHTITNDNYNQYFDLKGNLVSPNVKTGDTINLNGNITSKKFIFSQKLNIVGTSNNNLKNVMITLLNGASGSTIANLHIQNTDHELYGIFLNNADNCIVKNCIIKNTGRASYTICVANGANYNNITNNDLKAYGVTYGHGTRSTPALIVSGAHYNYIANNKVEVDDSNGIYLSSYAGGPLIGGESNNNIIYNNTVQCNKDILPTSWAYNIQVMGNNNTIKANKVIRGYRGISVSGEMNIITDNIIMNITGADYNNIAIETGGEYGIVGSYNAIIKNNIIINSKIISTGSGISAIDDSIIENNFINITRAGRGISAGGSNVIVKNNIIYTVSGSGVYQKDEGHGLVVDNNNITSVSGVGVLIEKLSSTRMPSNVTVTRNTIHTGNKVAIDASGVQANTSFIDEKTNKVFGKLINTPTGVIDPSKATYIYEGKTITINNANYDTYIDANGGLTSEVKDGDILNFEGTFNNQIIYITKEVKITGNNPIFYNSTFKVTSGNVLIENLTIINKNTDRVNAWGIFTNQAQGVRIQNNNISVCDPKASYAIYVLESTDVDVWNNILTSQGNYLTFTLLSYASEGCNFTNNKIKTIGTGEVYSFIPESCIDGNELVIDGKSYCIDGNELIIDGKSYCIDGEELVIDGRSYCIDGGELVVDGKSYCIDGNELVIDGRSYCIDGNELVIDGVKYSFNSTQIIINGTSYCIDGDEIVIDGRSYCIDGGELVIDGRSFCIDGNELVVDGRSYCIDGNELIIDGKSYCIDGNELVINGTSYGSTYSRGNAHVVSEIYQTYGILLLYSSNNIVAKNDVNVTSQLAEVHATTGKDNSTNSLVGIDLYFNSHNNVFSDNIINIKSKDNYIYGMGVLGYKTGHTAPKGQGATNNTFKNNIMNLEGPYFATGLIVGTESHDTILKNNTVNLKANGVTYGITLEISQESTVVNNKMNLESEVIYGMQIYKSNNNIINDNELKTQGKQVYGMVLSNSNMNIIKDNEIHANGTGESLTIKNLDSIAAGNTGVYIISNSTNNKITDNNITSTKGFSVNSDNTPINNIIADNYLECEKGIGNNAVNTSSSNTVEDNYKYSYITNMTVNPVILKYLGEGQFNVSFYEDLTGYIVKFYDEMDNFICQTQVINRIAICNFTSDYDHVPSNYIFKVKLSKENYKAISADVDVEIQKADSIVILNPISMIQGDTDTVELLIVDSRGNPVKGIGVKLTMIRARDVVMGSAVSDENGSVKIAYAVPVSLEVGNYTVRCDVDGSDCFNKVNVTTNFTTLPRLNVTISFVSSTYINGVVAYLTDSNGDKVINKTVSLKVGSVVYSIKTNEYGEVNLPVNVKKGSYPVIVTSTDEGKYNLNTGNASVSIIDPFVGTKDYSLYYGNILQYKVQILDTTGKPVGPGVNVSFIFNGKVINVKTDNSGCVVYTAKLGVGKYTIVVEYNNISKSNQITVKSLLTAKNIVKKKAKKIKFSVKVVNKNGKAAKKKKVLFKIKNKKYAAKTNKKGIATVSIKKLKVGKYVITSSYGGCSITNVIRVKK